MKLHEPKTLRKAILTGVRKTQKISEDEVGSYLERCVAEVAAHHVMGNIECGGVDDIDYWDTQYENFEAGLKIGAAMEPRDRVFTAYLDPGDDGPEIGTNHMFYFVGQFATSAVDDVKKKTEEWLKRLRKEREEKGLD